MKNKQTSEDDLGLTKCHVVAKCLVLLKQDVTQYVVGIEVNYKE